VTGKYPIYSPIGHLEGHFSNAKSTNYHAPSQRRKEDICPFVRYSTDFLQQTIK